MTRHERAEGGSRGGGAVERRPRPWRWLGSVAIVAGASLVAGACGGDDAGGSTARVPGDGAVEAGDGSSASGSGVLVGELEDGSTLRIRLDVEPADPAVAPFEALRALTGADEPVWIVGEVDVPADVASGEGSGRFVTFVAAGADVFSDDPSDPNDGVSQATFVCSAIDGWWMAAGAPMDPDDEITTAYRETYEGPCGSNQLVVPAPAGQTTTYVMIHPAPLPDYDRVLAGLSVELRPG